MSAVAEKLVGIASPITTFLKHHYRHFNAATVIDAAEAYVNHLASGGRMFVTLAGAMSTAELGLSLAEMIRQDKVHGICCTGANLEEDVFNLVAHDHYERVPHYRHLSPEQEVDAARSPPQSRHRHVHSRRRSHAPHRAHCDGGMAGGAIETGERFFPHEFLYKILLAGKLKPHYQIDPKDSWMMAACRTKSADLRSRLGGFHARQYVRRAGDWRRK